MRKVESSSKEKLHVSCGTSQSGLRNAEGRKLEVAHLDEFVAIEPTSKSQFLGKTFVEAAMAAKEAIPDRKSFVMRVGRDAAFHICGNEDANSFDSASLDVKRSGTHAVAKPTGTCQRQSPVASD